MLINENTVVILNLCSEMCLYYNPEQWVIFVSLSQPESVSLLSRFKLKQSGKRRILHDKTII